MPEQTERSFKPALGFRLLTPLFDPVVAIVVRERTFKARVLDQAQIRDGDSMLDLGCGTGTLAIAAHSHAQAASIVGLDADPDILRRARSKAAAAGAEISFDEGFSTELPYPDGSFDLVVSTLFFHHLRNEDKRRTLAEACRVLNPGGRIVIGDYGRPQGPFMRFVVLATIQLFDGFETTSGNVKGRLPSYLEEAGFSAVTTRDRLRTPTGTLEILAAERR